MTAALHDLLTESLLTVSEAAESLPAINGKKPSAKTVYAWVEVGLVVGSVRVKLESIKVGGRRVTSVEALQRFIEATSGVQSPQPIRTPAKRRKESEAAKTWLKGEFAKVKGGA